MKPIVIAALLFSCQVFFSQLLHASCEATIIKGQHTAQTLEDALAGSQEDAEDACYPGKATKMNVQCMELDEAKLANGQRGIRCVQEVSCTVCDDALIRKYEALD